MPKPEMLTFMITLNSNRCYHLMQRSTKLKFKEFTEYVFSETFLKEKMLVYRRWKQRDSDPSKVFVDKNVRGIVKKSDDIKYDGDVMYLEVQNPHFEVGTKQSRLHAHFTFRIVAKKYPDLTIDIDHNIIRELYSKVFNMSPHLNYRRVKSPDLLMVMYAEKNKEKEKELFL
jgi:hypothetical protein